MLGTLNAALEVRGIPMSPDDIIATAEGDNELVGGLPVLARIRVRYRLRIPSGQRETAERALAKHQAKCPTAAWMKRAVEITWEAEIEEK
jgi:organic hydroperoxide reductase OsmC/OhrA